MEEKDLRSTVVAGSGHTGQTGNGTYVTVSGTTVLKTTLQFRILLLLHISP